jgi:hypothetical protein
MLERLSRVIKAVLNALTATPRKIRTQDKIKPVLTNQCGFSSPIKLITRRKYKGCTRVKALRQRRGGTPKKTSA